LGRFEMNYGEFTFKKSKLFLYWHSFLPHAGWKWCLIPRFGENPCVKYDNEPGECYQMAFKWLFFTYHWDLNK